MATEIVNSAGDWDPVVWPYPQARFLSYYTLAFVMADQDDFESGLPAADNSIVLCELLLSDNVWTATAICDMGESSEISQLDILDFGPFYSACAYGRDDSDVPVISGMLRVPGASADPLYTSIPTAKVPQFICGCNFKGQAVIGGVNSTDPHWCNLGLAGVHWSRIGSFDFRPDENRTAGFMKMPWINNDAGLVLRVERLGNNVIVYGDGGRAVLIPRNSPMTTFGLREKPGFGISSGNHMAGDEHVHCFVDTKRDVWIAQWDSRYQTTSFERLGYREYMDNLFDYSPQSGDSRVIVSYEPRNGRFYFANGNQCYVLGKNGMYSTDQIVTSIGHSQGRVLCGFYVDGSDPRIVFTTGTLDAARRDMKSVEIVEFCGNYDKTSGDPAVQQPLYGAVKYRYDTYTGQDGFSTGSWVRLNKKGVFTQKITASEHRISIKADTYVGAFFDFDWMKVGIKYVDKQSVRGVINVSKANPGSS
jgi:hypothetical protein